MTDTPSNTSIPELREACYQVLDKSYVISGVESVDEAMKRAIADDYAKFIQAHTAQARAEGAGVPIAKYDLATAQAVKALVEDRIAQLSDTTRKAS